MLRMSMVVIALVLLGIAVPSTVDACVCKPGGGLVGFLGSAPQGEALKVPRNVAVFGATLSRADDSSEIELEELTFENLKRPEIPLPPDTEIQASATLYPTFPSTATAITTNDLDTKAPTAAVVGSVKSCSSGSGLGCCCEQSIEIVVLPEDDLTPTDELVYAVYSGLTAEEAMTSTQPSVFGRDPPLLVGYRGQSWIAVSVLDHAGNESPRSEAVRVDAPSGCNVARPSPARTSTWLWAACLLAWTALRIRTRRMP